MPPLSVPTISLFSGCGGSDYALRRAGYEIVWANDIWPVAAEIYDANIEDAQITVGDIAQFNEFPHAELLVGCYPCQAYSQAGSRDWNSNTNFLYRQFDRVLRKVRPRAFIVENVNGMAYGDNYNLLLNQIYRYRLAGYSVTWAVLNARDFGVAQNRRRIFLVGVRSDIDFEYEFPQPTNGPGTERPFVTQRDAIGNMPTWPEGEFNEEPFHWYYLSRRRRHTWGQPSPCIVGNWRHVPLHPLSPPLRRIDTDHWEFTSNGRARRFSYRECAALQGFVRRFRWNVGTVRDRFQAIGNAVPPPLFAAVIRPLQGIWE
jgi:DNA (cytosine-5)-methyltransferase 1